MTGRQSPPPPKPVDWVAVGRRIRAAYLRAGFNRSSFCRAIDAHYTTVIAWEKATHRPTDENLALVAEFTETTVPALLGYGGDPLDRPAALDDFLGSPLATGISDDHRHALEAQVWPHEPTFLSYQFLYQALLAQLSPAQAAEAAKATEAAQKAAETKRHGKARKSGSGSH